MFLHPSGSVHLLSVRVTLTWTWEGMQHAPIIFTDLDTLLSAREDFFCQQTFDGSMFENKIVNIFWIVWWIITIVIFLFLLIFGIFCIFLYFIYSNNNNTNALLLLLVIDINFIYNILILIHNDNIYIKPILKRNFYPSLHKSCCKSWILHLH